MTDEKRLYKTINHGTQDQIDEILYYIYNKYQPLIIFIASKYLNNAEDIKDVVQETFIEFFNDLNKEHTNIKSYLTVACKHNALDLLKKQKKIYIMTDEEQNKIMDEAIPHDTYREIMEDLNNYLTIEEVQIISYHLVDDMTFEEISKKINVNRNSIKSIYYRALKKYQKAKGIKKNETKEN